MTEHFANAYDDATRADSYAKLEFPGTYYLAYRDLPRILADHACGQQALDFGCGTGRSTRFLRARGFTAVGVDVSADMISRAKTLDPEGDYRLIPDGDFGSLPQSGFDLVLSVFTFDNIPSHPHRVRLLRGLKSLLNATGRIVLLDSTPELYVNQWASFSCKEFPQNATAGTGDIVRTIMLDVEDRRPVDDIFWRDEDYRRQFKDAELRLVESLKPLGKADDPVRWVSEAQVAPWIIYVLATDL